MASYSECLVHDPFGMILSGRNWSTLGVEKYIFGYQASMQDEEIYGYGNSYSTLFRELDCRLGRWISLDPKSSNTPWSSPFVSMGDNPITYNDIFGDEIPTTFYDSQGNETDQIPDEVQKMFNDEYGIKVAYDINTKTLFYEGEIGPSLETSQSLKDAWIYQLQKGCISDASLIFGYNLAISSNGVSATVQFGITEIPEIESATAVIDLADFDGQKLEGATYGNPLRMYPAAVNERDANLARIVEHEFFGHGVERLSDYPNDVFGSNPGPVELLMNSYKLEMGVNLRLIYGMGVSASKGEINYGPRYGDLMLDKTLQPQVGILVIDLTKVSAVTTTINLTH